MSEAELAPPERPLLQVQDLQVSFQTRSGEIPAVQGVSFTLYPRQSVAIVGESGSGKSTTAQAIIGLLPGTGRITSGSIRFDGVDLSSLSPRELVGYRGEKIGYVPQDPMSNLNPVWTVGFQVEEAIRANNVAHDRRAVRAEARRALSEAGLPEPGARMKQYPHQFSGGMRQRVLIGIGLAARPQLLIADEPTSALDVTVQRQILDHLATLAKEFATSVLFITHDLGLAAERAEHLVVMYRGRVVESGPSREILSSPMHPYTRRLVAAAPSLASKRIQTVRANEAEKTPVAEKETDEIIRITKARKVYRIRGKGRREIVAVDGVSLAVNRGTTTAIVGESGSGKSTLAKLFLHLETLSSGRLEFDGQDITKLNRDGIRLFRRRVQPVFQDPYGTLDPQYSVGHTIAEPLVIHRVGTPIERQARVSELLEAVALPAGLRDRYPSELSGGQRQRVAIARALALKPEVLVLDEAVSALDVLVQGQVLQLLTELQSSLNLSYLFITHDLAVVRLVADTVCVMRQGRIVEVSSTDEVFQNPKQDYTRELLAAIPGAGFEFAR